MILHSTIYSLNMSYDSMIVRSIIFFVIIRLHIIISHKSTLHFLLILFAYLFHFVHRLAVTVSTNIRILLPESVTPSEFRHDELGLRNITNRAKGCCHCLHTRQLVRLAKIDWISSSNERQFPIFDFLYL